VSASAASGLLVAGAASAATAPEDDVTILRRTLEVEQGVVVAYRRVLSSGKLEPRLTGKVGAILAQELVHVGTLRRALATRGASIPRAPRDVAAAQRGLAKRHMYTSLTVLRNQNECLKLLIDVESVAEGAYFEAIGKLKDPGLLRLSTQIMGCEAQHWTVLSGIRHHGDVMISVPYPFVQGSM
jgi:hypothetical protein